MLYSSSARPLQAELSALMLKGAMGSDNVRRHFLFSDCQLVDDDSVADYSSSIGQIKVCIDEIQVREYTSERQDFSLSPLVVHERAKKGIVHGVKLGRGVTKVKKMRNTISLRRLAVFIFNYRPLEYLMAEGIVPSPTSTKKDRQVPPEVIDLTLNEDVSDIKPHGSVKREYKRERMDGIVIDLTV